MSAAIQTVLFDCGGTLLEQRPRPVDVYLDVARRVVGRDLDRRAVAAAYRAVTFARPQSALALRGRDKRAYFDDYNRALGLFLGLDHYYDQLNPALQQAFARARAWQPFGDAVPTLEALDAAGLRLAVIANWDDNLDQVLKGAGLGRRFAGVYSSARMGVEKPDPRVFERAFRELGATPSTSCYVGDDYALDVIAARGAGVLPILIDRAGLYPDADCKVIASLSSLAALLSSPE